MGKFEKTPQPRPANRAPRPAQTRRKKQQNNLALIWGIGGGALLLVACLVGYFMLKKSDGGNTAKPEANRIIENAYVAGVPVGGMTREEALEALRAQFPAVDTTGMSEEEAKALANTVTFGDKMENMDIRLYRSDDVMELFTTTYDPSKEQQTDMFGEIIEHPQNPVPTPDGSGETTEPEETEELPGEPIEEDPDAPLDEDGKPYILENTICLPKANVEIRFDLQEVVEAAYQFGRAAEVEAADRHDVDISKFLQINDHGYIDDVLSRLNENATEGGETTYRDAKTFIDDEDGNPVEVDCIEIQLGSIQRELDLNDLKEEILRTYMVARFDLQYIYDEKIPQPLDLDKLYKDYKCVAPVDAVCDKETYEITESEKGWGFTMRDAYEKLSAALPGDTVVLPLTDLEPARSTETIKNSLFSDVLATYDSPHVWNPTRTRNLELASKAIDGTILNPGDIFSFNDIVGERTADKGYGEAGVYVGGRTENQLGGGVCQVASTLYWCTLKADLEVIERAEHQFTPSYVPWGMDATIYWGYLDYRFRNNTPYPIRIDASVSDGYVHVTFVGTETKDYTVKLFYEIQDSDKAEEKTVYIHPDMKNYSKFSGYTHGETIQTAYDGYKVYTYMQKIDKNGNVISTDRVNISNYDRRDKEVAYLLDPSIPMNQQIDSNGNLIETTEPTEPPTESTEPTEPPTESTEPPTESTEPTEPPTESTEPPTESTEPLPELPEP
ncbi:MAG: hypothetical protein E7467_07340 [Ruminococcaceae bacterium]|nr:hypothetical protein [Oscillospiraceae bacterium]